MADLVVIGCEKEHEAEEVRLTLLKLQSEYLIDMEDAVVAIKKPNGKIKLLQSHDLTAAGAVRGGFFGALIGLIFFSPLIGAAIGASAGAVSGALTDMGIDNDFMKRLAKEMEPGHSVLFVLVREATPDKVLDELSKYKGHVLRTSLSHENEAKLQAALDCVKSEAAV